MIGLTLYAGVGLALVVALYLGALFWFVVRPERRDQRDANRALLARCQQAARSRPITFHGPAAKGFRRPGGDPAA